MGQIATEASTSHGIECCVCGTAFWMEGALYKRRRDDHDWFYCPNGHQQHFPGETDEQKRIRELQHALTAKTNEADRHREMRQWAERNARGAWMLAGKAKAKLRRTLERVHAGVCPHCHRTFKQLAAHMKSKHKPESY